MNALSPVDPLGRFALAQARFAAGTALTLLCVGEQESVVVTGNGAAAPAVHRLAIGVMRLGRGPFSRQPPTPLELENAIAVVEDALMPLAHALPPASTLIVAGEGVDALDALGGVADPQSGLHRITREALENGFQRLAAQSTRGLGAADALPGGVAASAMLLILREAMHHLHFDALRIDAAEHEPLR